MRGDMPARSLEVGPGQRQSRDALPPPGPSSASASITTRNRNPPPPGHELIPGNRTGPSSHPRTACGR